MMMNEPRRFEALRGTLTRGAPLARYTSWRCGGAGDRVYVPADRDDLATFVRQLGPDEPLTVIGLGSNLLIRDGGVRGTVVVLHAALNKLEMRDGLLHAEAGVASPKVARFAARHDLAGAEFLAGIPGTVGGALAMNAGCYGGETWRFVARVEVLGARRIASRSEPRPHTRSAIASSAAPMAARLTASSLRRGSSFRRGDGRGRARAHPRAP